jgi:hypothetical protein
MQHSGISIATRIPAPIDIRIPSVQGVEAELAT